MSPFHMPIDPALTPSARQAARLQFFVLGITAGTWGVHIPNVKTHYGLSDGSLSMALLAVAAGAVLSLFAAGSVVQHLGSRRTVRGAGLLVCATLGGVLMPGGYAALLLMMGVLGMASALMDVAINAEGTVLEAHGGRKIMSGLHGMFSLGGMAGAGLGALLAQAGVAPLAQLLAVGAACAVAILAGSRHMLAAHPPRSEAGESGTAARRPHGALIGVAVLVALGMLAEGTMYDWSVLYMKQELGAAQTLAALGYASFSAAMAAARFGGDALRSRVAPGPLLAVSALVSAGALAVVLLVGDPFVALVGFALAGAGLANVVPILFMAAAGTPGVPAPVAIAAVSSIGYLGFVAGPPLVGGIAQHSSLSWGLAVAVVAAGVLAWGARRLPGLAAKVSVPTVPAAAVPRHADQASALRSR